MYSTETAGGVIGRGNLCHHKPLEMCPFNNTPGYSFKCKSGVSRLSLLIHYSLRDNAVENANYKASLIPMTIHIWWLLNAGKGIYTEGKRDNSANDKIGQPRGNGDMLT